MCCMGSVQAIELLPRLKFLLQIHIIGIRQQLVELLMIRPVGSLNLPVKLWRSRLDINMLHAPVFNMPMELGLELMPSVSSDGVHPKRES